MSTPTNVEKSFDKAQHPFMIKKNPESGHSGNITPLNKGHT